MTRSAASALFELHRLRVRGAMRSMFGQVKSVRGALMAIVAAGGLTMIVGANIASALTQQQNLTPEPANEQYVAYVAIGLFAMCLMTTLTSAGEQAIYFSPAEVDLLFPGPFSRRHLLLYKIIPSALGSLLVGVLFATSMSSFTKSWIAAMVGITLSFQFIKGASMCGQLLVQNAAERAYTRTRKAVWMVVLLAVGACASQAFFAHMPSSLGDAAESFRTSLAGRALLAPFLPFAETILADGVTPSMIGWATISLAIIGVVYAVALSVDANYLEAAVRVSQRIQEKKDRLARGGIFAARSTANVKSSRVPKLGWWGGVGPLARRQLVVLSRQSGGAMLLVLLAAAPLALVLFRQSGAQLGPDSPIPWIVISATAYLTLLLSMQGMFGFKSDFEHMDLLKSLPIRPLAMAVGETAPIVFGASAFHATIAAVLAGVFPQSAAGMAVVGVFSLPFNALLFGVDNILFLLWPHRIPTTGDKSFLMTAHVMLLMLIKTIVLAVCAAVAFLPSGIVYAITGNLIVAGAVCWIVLAMETGVVAFLLGAAFARFDVGRDGV